jgi:hypothetical protein
MRISRTFIKLFLVLLLVIVIGNVAAMIFSSYQSWMAYTTIGFFIALFSLIFRKSRMGYIKVLFYFYLLFYLYLSGIRKIIQLMFLMMAAFIPVLLIYILKMRVVMLLQIFPIFIPRVILIWF